MTRRRNFVFSTIFLLLTVGTVICSNSKTEKKDDKNSEKKLDENVALDRSLNVEHEDQLAVESAPSYQSIAPPPPSYGAGSQGVGAPYPGPIPVPLPLPVQPGSIVLPSLPLGSKGKGGGVHGGVGGHAKGKVGGGGGGGYVGGPPPIVHKQPRAPLTRSSNPSPVSQFTEGGGSYQPPPPPPPQLPKQSYGESIVRNYVAPPPQNSYAPPSPQDSYAPPPPQESYVPPPPQDSYVPPPTQESYVPPPPQDSYAPPSDSYSPPPSNELPSDIYNAPIAPPPQAYNAPPPVSDGYSAPKSSDIYEGRQPILSPSSSDFRDSYQPPQQSIAHLQQSPVSNYQAPPQLSAQPSGYSGADSDISGSAYVPPSSLVPDEPWLISTPDMPQIANINVKCEKHLMRVTIDFDRPFYGIIFSKGHYSNVNCVHLPAGLGRTSSTFDISINSCGTIGNTENGQYGYGSQSGSGSFFENTLVIQYDPQVQEVWDQARKLRCTWHDQYEKSVTFKPFPVDMLDVVRADFAGDNVGCWMQIQVGKGPWASEVSGLVKIGQTMTMVLAIKDEDNKFDMLVRNCMAHDGKKAPIQLVDQRGCVTRPKLMSRFTKIKNFGASASVLSYAHFQAFKFPDSMEVHFQCTIQICRYQCPEQCADSSGGYVQQPGTAYDVPAAVGQPRDNYRRKRATNETESIPKEEKEDIGVNRIIQVVSTRDLSFLIDKSELLKEMKETDKETFVSVEDDSLGLICMSTPGFAATLVVLLSILVISCLLSAFLCLRFRGHGDTQSIISSYQNPAFLHKKRFFF